MAIARAKMVAILNTVIDCSEKQKRESGQPDRVSFEHGSTSRIAKIVFVIGAHL